jgi:dTDP-D-glucose 4,6-dehydratase
MIFVTGGAGFIGANFVLSWLAQSDETVLNYDKLTYAGNLNNLTSLRHDNRHIFVQGDICDGDKLTALFAEHKPRAIVHFAAESHVDRSIHGPAAFVTTNVNGTFSLLEAARAYWNSLEVQEKTISVFCMYPPMKCMERWVRKIRHSAKQLLTRRTARILHRKQHPIIWFALITILMACQS